MLSLSILFVVYYRARRITCDSPEQPQQKPQFLKVPEGYFKVKKVDSDEITLRELLKFEEHELHWNKHNIFLDYDSLHSKPEGIRDIDVLLLDKVSRTQTLSVV